MYQTKNLSQRDIKSINHLLQYGN